MRVPSLYLAVVAGCATATSPQNLDNTDAHLPADAAPPGTDGRPPTDAAPPHDGPVTQHDAPPGSCATPMSGVIAAWSFTGASGSQASTAASSMATGLTAGPVTRAGVTATAGANSMNSNNWPTSASLDPTKYYTLTLTPPSGCLLDLTSMAVDGLASGTGPNTAQLATSADSFAGTTGVAVTTTSTPALSVAGASGAVEVRIYGFGATSTSGTFRIQNTLSITGSLH